MPPFAYGDLVVLASGKAKKWIVRIEDTQFTAHVGTVKLRELVGRDEGDLLETTKGEYLRAYRPSLFDYIYRMNRQTQIVYPKDMAAICMAGDLKSGDLVLESGVGSGALSLGLLRAIGREGRLVSVEKRPEFAKLARKNIRKFLGHDPDNHHIVVADISEPAVTLQADCAILDLPEPWTAIPYVAPLLRRGGLLVSLSPSVGQVQLTQRDLRAHGFANIASFELLRRDWLIDDRRARPADRMIAHTMFITQAKRVGEAAVVERDGPDATPEDEAVEPGEG